MEHVGRIVVGFLVLCGIAILVAGVSLAIGFLLPESAYEADPSLLTRFMAGFGVLILGALVSMGVLMLVWIIGDKILRR